MSVTVSEIMYSMRKMGIADTEFEDWVNDIVYDLTVDRGITIDSYQVSTDKDKIWLGFDNPDDEYEALEVCLQSIKIGDKYVTKIRLLNVTEFSSTFTSENIADIVCEITNRWYY